MCEHTQKYNIEGENRVCTTLMSLKVNVCDCLTTFILQHTLNPLRQTLTFR